ncbi:MAG: hypothetical protein COT71_02050 [Candidatus Andersenbacteria bacterium CG10_big_fil_rev_8_21_14_0_10_54_11]|uniref:Uncharacterized protein n=1 Tax=Candidatus Andersenbacteria bacterium CG10_big_fil_rev_8_21_14_0_10_54_11 TaxID=1974485 RepID=A0A2M6WZJ1_9BACT|nr:MAG: hypothetical protein COT71_02050 [Candidatus Andersenbacteria bacterium CG10_big_fil_rev_8_21_14_0_10_54_11]
MIAFNKKPAPRSLGEKPKKCCRCKAVKLPNEPAFRPVPELLFVTSSNFEWTHCPPCRKQREAAMDAIYTQYGSPADDWR